MRLAYIFLSLTKVSVKQTALNINSLLTRQWIAMKLRNFVEAVFIFVLLKSSLLFASSEESWPWEYRFSPDAPYDKISGTVQIDVKKINSERDVELFQLLLKRAISPLKEVNRILIVGHGSGEEVYAAKRTYPSAEILAVDPKQASNQKFGNFTALSADYLELEELAHFDLVILRHPQIFHNSKNLISRLIDRALKDIGEDGILLVTNYTNTEWRLVQEAVMEADKEILKYTRLNFNNIYFIYESSGLPFGRDSYVSLFLRNPDVHNNLVDDLGFLKVTAKGNIDL